MGDRVDPVAEWASFAAGEDSAVVTGVRSEILGSWQRSRFHGIQPERLEIAQAEFDHESPFVRAGAPVLLGMADLLVGTSSSLALADVDGTVAWRWESEPSLARQLDRSEFAPGSALAEPSAGTNGLGVAIADRTATLVVGAEHYKQAWHRWACAAAPVVHPVTRRICGAVNVACRVPDANPLLQVALRALVGGVRAALQDAATARERRLVDAHVRYRAATAGPVVALDGRTMIVDDGAAGLGLERSVLWAAVREAGPSTTEIPVGDAHTARLFAVSPGRLDDGVVLVLRRRHPPRTAGPAPRIPPALRLSPLEQAEAAVIRETLAELGGNKSRTAARMSISRGTLYDRMRRYGLL